MKAIVEIDVDTPQAQQFLEYARTLPFTKVKNRQSKLSKQAVLRRCNRMILFLNSFGNMVDYPKCRFQRWCALNYRCAVFEKDRVFAYETVPEGVIVRDMSHTALLET